ncbi:reverse transcriptase domain-containing protein, partial [Tanacetum coccineum]
ILKDGGEDFCYSGTERLSRSNEVLKLKNFKKDATLKLSKSTNQEWKDSRHGHRSRDRGRSRIMKRGRTSESPLSRVSESGTSGEGRWKLASKRQKLIDEEDLAVPWTCEEVDLFTPQIRNFKSSRKMRIPNKVKTYDGTGDPENHVKKFQVAAQLPPESIDGYKDLKAAFLAYFMQQKKYVKDPVEIHNIKQRDGETLKDFIERFKVETGRMKGALKYMRISRFMHGLTTLS